MRVPLFILLTVCWLVTGGSRPLSPADDPILSVVVDPHKQQLRLYYKDDSGQLFHSLGAVKNWCDRRRQQLVFAMNGGMFKPDNTPVGLFIQQGKTLNPLDTLPGEGNFYLQPNGVFFLTKEGNAAICSSKAFRDDGQIAYATQSGPMLLINGDLHPAFRAGSANLNIRNGVGILPDNKILFALSKTPVNFYDFAQFFKSRGCRNALFLDGFVSRAWLRDSDWMQTDGNFGVIIGVTVPQ